MTHRGHITKKGDRWLRRNMIECARSAVRKDPSIREFYMRLRRKKGDGKAVVAVARKLTSYAYWILKRNVTSHENLRRIGRSSSLPSSSFFRICLEDVSVRL